jgi:hypothetical protein
VHVIDAVGLHSCDVHVVRCRCQHEILNRELDLVEGYVFSKARADRDERTRTKEQLETELRFIAVVGDALATPHL